MRLRVPQEATCPFLEEGGCSIHPAKPTQCRIFPFWPELLESRREWKKAARYCPGIGKGPLIQIEKVKAQAAEMREGYPTMYD
jgi:Fe-S-cluster containining protein